MRGARIFYGWWIVAAGFGIEVLIGAFMFHTYGAYLVLLREEFGWSRTMLSAAFSMARVESGILGPLQGWLTDRFGPRALIQIGVGVFGVGFILFSRINSPFAFFATYFLVAVGSSLAGNLSVGVAIVAWFRRRRALALSLSGMGMAVGGLLTPLVVLGLSTLGWRWMAFASGVLVLMVGLPLAQIVRHRPEPYGLAADGDPPAAMSARARAPAAPRRTRVATTVDFTAREALRTPAFWYLSVGHGCALLVVSAVAVHLIVHITERLGYTLAQGGFVVGLLPAMQVVGQLVGGWLGDRTSKRTIAAACMLGHATALVLLAFATAFWMVVLAGALQGLAWGTRGPIMSAIRADYFGAAAFGTISGISSMVLMFGMMAGPLVAGVLADRTGSYVPGFTILAACAATGSVFFILARRPEPPLRETRRRRPDAVAHLDLPRP